MTLLAKKEEKVYKLVDEGLYVAKCVSVIYLGTQPTEFEGKKSLKPQVMLQFEIPEIVIEFKKDDKLESFNKILSKTYTVSLGDLATLRKDLTRWRNRAFTQEELDGFNLSNVLGKDCQIQIIHEKKNDKTFQKIEILPVGKGHKSIKVENELLLFDLEENGIEGMLKLPEWMQEKIKKSTTYEELRCQSVKSKYDESEVSDEDFHDDLIGEEEIPF